MVGNLAAGVSPKSSTKYAGRGLRPALCSGLIVEQQFTLDDR